MECIGTAFFRIRRSAGLYRILAVRSGDRKVLMLFAAATLLGVLAAIPVRWAQGSVRESSRQGQALFVQKGCARCHDASPEKENDAPNLDSVGRRMNKRAIQQQILNGGKQMPAFRDVLTQAETRDLVEYLSHQKK